MVIEDLERHATRLGLLVEYVQAGDQSYLRITGMPIRAGTHVGKECEVAILQTGGTPWVPQAAVHVRPHLVPMGERYSQASPLGPDWQYLSRRFDRVPTPKNFMTHILTVIEEL